MSINANKEYDAFMAYAREVQLPEDQCERGYVIWLAAKRHAAEVGEPTLEQQHEAAAAQLLASAPVEPVDALWGDVSVPSGASFNATEFDAMVEKGTAVWSKVPDNWLEEHRNGPSGASMEGDALDGERYRWLRDQMCFSTSRGEAPTMSLSSEIESPDHNPHQDWVGDRFDASVDRAIDAAMSPNKEGGEP